METNSVTNAISMLRKKPHKDYVEMTNTYRPMMHLFI